MTIERTASFAVRPDGLARALAAISRSPAHTETEPDTLLYMSVETPTLEEWHAVREGRPKEGR
jgi:hypothetical protein